MRKSIVSKGTLAAAAVLLIAGLGLRVEYRLAGVRRAVKLDIARERIREAAHERSPAGESLVPQDAAPLYRSLLEGADAWDLSTASLTALREAAEAGPDVVPSQAALEVLERHRDALAALRSALRSERCNWRFDYEHGFAAKVPSVRAVRSLVYLLLVDGHRAGSDPLEAAHSDLEALRFATDIGRGPLIMTMTGSWAAREALDGLGRLIPARTWDNDSTLKLLKQLGSLEPELPSLADGLRRERLCLGSLADEAWRGGGLEHWQVALALPELDAAYRALERGLARADGRRFEEVLARFEARAEASCLLSVAMPDLRRLRTFSVGVQARFRLVRTLLLLEQSHASTRAPYPFDVSEVGLPRDPYAPDRPLHYAPAPDGSGYRLWSVGQDGRDDGGVESRDIVLSRVSSSEGGVSQ
jgi:hypothetical protein